MAGLKQYNADIEIFGGIKLTNVPNRVGSLVTWNQDSKELSLRTAPQIVTDLGLDDVVNNSHTHTNKSVLDGITSTKVSTWDTVTSKANTNGSNVNGTWNNLTSGNSLKLGGQLPSYYLDYNNFTNTPTPIDINGKANVDGGNITNRLQWQDKIEVLGYRGQQESNSDANLLTFGVYFNTTGNSQDNLNWAQPYGTLVRFPGNWGFRPMMFISNSGEVVIRSQWLYNYHPDRKVWDSINFNPDTKANIRLDNIPTDLTQPEKLVIQSKIGISPSYDTIFAYSNQGGLYTTNWLSNATSEKALAIGHSTNATQQSAIAIGSGVFTGGFASIGLGHSLSTTKALANNIGYSNSNKATISNTLGIGLLNSQDGLSVIGRYNKPTTMLPYYGADQDNVPVFTVGIGQDETTRKDGMTAFSCGRTDYVDYDESTWNENTLVTKGYVDQRSNGGVFFYEIPDTTNVYTQFQTFDSMRQYNKIIISVAVRTTTVIINLGGQADFTNLKDGTEIEILTQKSELKVRHSSYYKASSIEPSGDTTLMADNTTHRFLVKRVNATTGLIYLGSHAN